MATRKNEADPGAAPELDYFIKLMQFLSGREDITDNDIITFLTRNELTGNSDNLARIRSGDKDALQELTHLTVQFMVNLSRQISPKPTLLITQALQMQKLYLTNNYKLLISLFKKLLIRNDGDEKVLDDNILNIFMKYVMNSLLTHVKLFTLNTEVRELHAILSNMIRDILAFADQSVDNQLQCIIRSIDLMLAINLPDVKKLTEAIIHTTCDYPELITFITDHITELYDENTLHAVLAHLLAIKNEQLNDDAFAAFDSLPDEQPYTPDTWRALWLDTIAEKTGVTSIALAVNILITPEFGELSADISANIAAVIPAAELRQQLNTSILEMLTGIRAENNPDLGGRTNGL